MSIGGSSKAKTTDTRESGRESIVGAKTGSSQLVLEDEAVAQIIRDVLSGAGGLASIFAGEQTAGIFDSSVAASASGDLVAKLVGEIAKLTGETVTSGDFTQDTAFSKESRTNELDVEAEGKFGI